MKTRYNSILRLFLLSGISMGAFTSCTQNYMDYNRNESEVTKKEMERDGYLLSAAMLGMQNNVIPVEEHLNQFTECLLGGAWGGYFADSQTWASSFSHLNQSQDWLGKLYMDVMPNIYSNWNELKNATSDPVILSVGQIIKTAALARITDSFGPIPYSQVGINGKLTAPFDSQKEIYYTMFDELNTAISTLMKNQTNDFTANADDVFKGKVEKWIKFANSLKLRMAMRLVYADVAKAEAMAKEAIDISDGKLGVMTQNSDNAFMKVNINPFYKVCYEYNGGETKVSADLLRYMNSWADGRREKYAKKSTFNSTDEYKNKNITDDFHGLRMGNTYSIGTGQCYSNVNVGIATPILWMNAAEVMFLRAEAAIYGWDIAKTPTEYYEEGIRLSFSQWGAANVDTYLANKTVLQFYIDPLDTYTYAEAGSAATVTAKWDNGASQEERLERIITQKWIANFPLGLESWAEFRRTGYPRFMPTPTNKSGGDVVDGKFARRLTYPQTEYKTNGSNVNDAIKNKLKGADRMSTHIWWDCNPRLVTE